MEGSRRARYKVVVSDFHMGSGPYFKDGSRNILEDFNNDEPFISLLVNYSSGEYVHSDVELVLNGDFLNLLQINYMGVHTYLMTERIVVFGLKQIIAGHRALFTALKKFAAKPHHSITYVIGNHDQGMLFAGAQSVFAEALGSEVKFVSEVYEFDGVHIEHGHMHEWPSRFEVERFTLNRGLPEPVLNLPWASLFVAECLPRIKMGRSYVDKVKPFRALLRWMVINDTIFAFRTLGKILGFIVDTLLFRQRYRYSTLKATFALVRDLTIYPHFEREAAKIFDAKPHINAVVMGHTHVLRYRRFRGGKEYFNIGTWNEATSLDVANLGVVRSLTYALIEYPEIPEGVDTETVHDKTLMRPRIQLKEWKGEWRAERDVAVL